MKRKTGVKAWTEELLIPTYVPFAPDRNPMFLEKRVYQGSSGRVYPLPFTDRIAETKTDRMWRAVWLENEYLRLLVLPEIGGRIHRILDKTNGYDLIYHQPVIKPALVGLAGPWISGGIEFNWPQHHRPATFLPVDCEIENHPDGSKTVWCSDHDPMSRMKGMHGVCLHPGKAYVELKVRACNRTPFVQTFLWWANVAARVHEAYQSFFPPDVHYVADHARRAMSEYPLCRGFYYGVNYGERGRKGVPPSQTPAQFIPPHCLDGTPAPEHVRNKSKIKIQKSKFPSYASNDLSWYANIPTPCSYMCLGSKEDFFGGYDYFRQAGLVHVANHHISPGKKQWTWGNHDFGYAWDRNLTEADAHGEFGPYIELMAGVYTDNQPDFSFLQPGETKAWSQYWYPIHRIGPAQHADLEAAVSLHLETRHPRTKVRLGVAVTRPHNAATVTLSARGRRVAIFRGRLSPAEPLVRDVLLPKGSREGDLKLTLTVAEGRELISYTPSPREKGELPAPATEPSAPKELASTDELYLTGLHLEQYRHATRCPTMYWREALRRDPLDARCNNAMGLWHLRRGEFDLAESHFHRAIARLTARNANPYDGEPFYNLGICLRYRLDSQSPIANRQDRSAPRRPSAIRDRRSAIGDWLFAEAYAAFYKATWNQSWAAAGYHALAEMDCRRANWARALEHLDLSLRFNTDNTRARDLKAIVLRKLGRETVAVGLLRATRALDPLDWWARHLLDEPLRCDAQTCLDLAWDCARAGLYSEAAGLLSQAAGNLRKVRSRSMRSNDSGVTDLPDQNRGVAPVIHYCLGWLQDRLGNRDAARRQYQCGAQVSPDYCFPSRLEEIIILEAAMAANPRDARAPYYLGNLLYDRRRHEEAIRLWERSVKLDPKYSVAWRNLGIGYFNVLRNPAKARRAYDRALRANPEDARLLFERDQLWKRLGETPARRLRVLARHPHLIPQRDDLSIELCGLYNQTGQPDKALRILSTRKFQPWEGGEGQALGQHVRTHLALGREALARRDFSSAASHFQEALESPENLGEAKHLLANQSDIHYWLGIALELAGDKQAAREHWLAAATFRGDFQEMSVRSFSGMTYYSARSWERLGECAKARRLFRELLAHARKLRSAGTQIDYFATSLPTMLLFEEDLQFRQETTSLFLQAQAQLGLGRQEEAARLLGVVLERDPNHAPASDLQEELREQASSGTMRPMTAREPLAATAPSRTV